MRALRLTDDAELTRLIASEALAERLAQPSITLRIEFGGPLPQGRYFGSASWDNEHDCHVVRLDSEGCTWHDLAHEIAHCVYDIEPGHVYDCQSDPHEKIQKVIDVDPARGRKLEWELLQRELRAGYDADYILTELRDLAEARGYELCD